MTRTGPKPLSLHLSMASLAAAGFAGGAAFSQEDLEGFFKGIQKYQAHPFKRSMPPLETVWQAGSVRLLRVEVEGQGGAPDAAARHAAAEIGGGIDDIGIKGDALADADADADAQVQAQAQAQALAADASTVPPAKPAANADATITPRRHKTSGIPVIVIPSMINGSAILDLLPDRSFVRFLAGQGLEVYLLDWGEAAKDPGLSSFDTAMRERLLPALDAAGAEVMLLGYCMGGLFAAAASVLRPNKVKGLVMLAAPWNFHDSEAALKNRISVMKPAALPYMAQHGRLPESWVQAVFATLDPEGSIRKFAAFAALPERDKKAELFVAVEDWLNEGGALPAAMARSCMEEWYERNLPHNGEWLVCGEVIAAENVACPALVVAAKEDKIVPLESALSFGDKAGTERILCATGHIGLMVSRDAAAAIWAPVARWLAAQQR
ncbi:MAG: alpha/beta fold hydrolase [Micavibrio sp.]